MPNGPLIQNGLEEKPQGIFCSVLILITYAAHLKKVKQVASEYGNQIRGLALAMVAVSVMNHLIISILHVPNFLGRACTVALRGRNLSTPQSP
jgi:hypothetical protein